MTQMLAVLSLSIVLTVTSIAEAQNTCASIFSKASAMHLQKGSWQNRIFSTLSESKKEWVLSVQELLRRLPKSSAEREITEVGDLRMIQNELRTLSESLRTIETDLINSTAGKTLKDERAWVLSQPNLNGTHQLRSIERIFSDYKNATREVSAWNWELRQAIATKQITYGAYARLSRKIGHDYSY